MIRSVGIVGLGSFGNLAAALLPTSLDIVGYDSRRVKSAIRQVELAEVVTCDAVILAIPLAAYQDVLPQIRPSLKPDTLLLDVCSVKIKPTELLAEHLPNHSNVLLTHPLFGPETTSPGRTKGLDLIVTKSKGDKAAQALEFCKEKLGLSIHHMTAEAHDLAMAKVHVLTFFVARGLANMRLGKVPFETPSFQMVLDLVELDSKHSDELFRTIQQGNPYAAKVRQQLLKSFENLAIELGNKA